MKTQGTGSNTEMRNKKKKTNRLVYDLIEQIKINFNIIFHKIILSELNFGCILKIDRELNEHTKSNGH